MSYGKRKIEGGQGGKLGHSQMSHWEKTHKIKAASKAMRRLDTKRIIHDAKRGQLSEYDD